MLIWNFDLLCSRHHHQIAFLVDITGYEHHIRSGIEGLDEVRHVRQRVSLDCLATQIHHQELLRAQQTDELLSALDLGASRVQNLLVRLLVELHI